MDTYCKLSGQSAPTPCAPEFHTFIAGGGATLESDCSYAPPPPAQPSPPPPPPSHPPPPGPPPEAGAYASAPRFKVTLGSAAFDSKTFTKAVAKACGVLESQARCGEGD